MEHEKERVTGAARCAGSSRRARSWRAYTGRSAGIDRIAPGRSQLEHDALAQPWDALHPCPHEGVQRRVDGAEQERTHQTYAKQASAQDTRPEHFDVDFDVGGLGHRRVVRSIAGPTWRYAGRVSARVVMFCLGILLLALVVPGCGDSAGVATSCTVSGDTSAVTSATGATTGSPTGSTPGSTPATSGSTTTVVSSTTTQLTPGEVILRGMTLREKAAQVLLLAFDGTTLLPATERLLLENPPGGLLLLARNVTGADQIVSLTAALQDTAAAGGSKAGLLIAVDQEGGAVQRIRSGVPIVPAARVLGEDSSLTQVAGLAEETAIGLLKLGVNMNLAPVADVVSDPKSFLYRRTYSGDPTLVSDYVETVAGAFLRSGLICAVKHFPGHGSASGDTHGEAVVSDAGQTEFATIHLLPFKAALAIGVECVMVAHIVATAYDPDRPASLSSRVIGGLLREGLGFSGLVVADDLEMAAAAGIRPGQDPVAGTSDIGQIAVSALEAGCDLLISTGTLARQQSMIDAIVEAVQTERLSEERLEEAVLRVLDLKSRHNLLAI